MRVSRLLIAALLALPAAAGPGKAQEAPAPLARHFFRLPAAFDGRVSELEAMELRPRAPGRFPLAIIAHGTPGSDALRRQYKVEIFTAVAVEFARRGFATLAFLRRGYGTSDGGYAESDGVCGRSIDYANAGVQSARDLTAAIAFMSSLPHVDARRVVVVGQSAGGFAALALAGTPPPGLLGVVNFAGGRGHFAERNTVCEPDKLVAAFGLFGQRARVPSLWVYAENDWLFTPDLARRMLHAYRAGGAPADLSMLPAFRDDGHLLFLNGIAQWRPAVDDFLARMGFPQVPRGLTVMPSAVTGKAVEAFRLYVDSPLPNKAFAVSGRGFAWKSGMASIAEARREAVIACQRHGAPCAAVHEVKDFDDE